MIVQGGTFPEHKPMLHSYLCARTTVDFGAQDLITRRRKMRARVLCALLTLLLIAVPTTILLVSCGGGGSGGSSVAGSSGTGTVAVSIADNPTDDYSAIWVRITEVSLLPGPVVIFESQAGKEINLLEHRDNNDYLLKVNYKVPAGTYDKIRLKISDIWAEPKPGTAAVCTDNIKLPSNKIDLNPQGTFKVTPGGTLAIRLDFAANAAFDLHPAGNSGKCIFRPVIFVDIGEGIPVQKCPQVIAGTIAEITYNNTGQPVDFVLERKDNKDSVNGHLTTDVVVFDGDFVSPSVLTFGQQVKVVGKFDEHLVFQVSTVVIGDVFTIKGDVETDINFVDASMNVGQFTFNPFQGEEILGPFEVEVERGDTSILIGCDQELQPEDIQAGMTARVIGKFITGDNVLRAVAVFLKPREISGILLSWNPTADGNYIIMDVDGVTVYVPRMSEPNFPYNQFYPIYLEQDGLVPLGLLCDTRRVRVVLDPYASNPLVAEEVRVQAEPPEGKTGTVTENNSPVLVLDKTQQVYVLPAATIIDERPGGDVTSVDDFVPGHNLFYHGLDACTGDANNVDSYAFIVQVVP